jgi:hypothetical protein
MSRSCQHWAGAAILGLIVLGGCDKTAEQPEATPQGTPERPVAAPAEQTAKPGEIAMKITIESSAFKHNETIPRKYTGDGEDLSPPLSWSGVPDGTKELALIMDDPDAPRPEPWVHWVLYKLPATVTSLPEGVATTETLSEPAGARQGKNTWPAIGYRGPAPPKGHGVHHYHFKLYALDTALDVQPGLTKDQLLAKMQGHILAEGELIGTYER